MDKTGAAQRNHTASELSKRVKEQKYVSNVRMAYERIVNQGIKSVEK